MNKFKYVAVICFAAAALTGFSAVHDLANNDTSKAASEGTGASLSVVLGALMMHESKRSPS